MMLDPRPGQRVQLWYRKAVCHLFPLHGKVGTVVFTSRGKPRNCCVEVNGKHYSVSCGNLRPCSHKGTKTITVSDRGYLETCDVCGAVRRDTDYGPRWFQQTRRTTNVHDRD